MIVEDQCSAHCGTHRDLILYSSHVNADPLLDGLLEQIKFPTKTSARIRAKLPSFQGGSLTKGIYGFAISQSASKVAGSTGIHLLRVCT